MSDIVLRIEHLWKEYRLGKIGHGTLYRDLQSGWARYWGKEDPNTKIGSSYQSSVNRIDDRFWALQDLSFDVRQGDVVGIIGRNGAGKSTLLKIISRVTAPTRGSVKIKGRVASLLEVGTGFHPELSGRENIFLNGAILGMNKRETEQKFDEIIQFAEIEKFIDTPVKRYSSGMYVRLAFAVAAHLDPEILIVDEVLAVGDTGFQKKCLGKMSEVSKGGRTVLFVSHNMGAIAKLCSRCLVLESGRIDYVGDAASSIEHYLSNSIAFSNTSLKERKDRRGNGRIQYTAISLENLSGRPVSSLVTGMGCAFRMRYSTNEGNIKNVVFIVRILHRGEIITILNNRSTGQFYDLKQQDGEITCIIKKLPLYPGDYTVTCAIKIGNDEVDTIPDAISFTVDNGDFYGSGNLPGRCLFVMDHHWVLD